ncbi:MAG: flavodoxin family protein [Planctomycetes bacterium]|nr:flavodoxin family protein [Planctomycetota bacterium]
MKILGISGSGRDEKTSNCYRLVKRILDSTGMDYELISLRGKVIRGCIACLGCVQDNVCVVKDDLWPLREKIVEADGYVIGAPNYYSGINATTAALLERWFQFRHRTGDLLWGKSAVAVGVGGGDGSVVADRIEQIMGYNFIETVAKVSGQGTASCFSCGYGESCKVGVPCMLYGEGVKITKEMIPDISKQPQVLQAAEQAGKELAKRLVGHNRSEITKKMQKIMMEHFKKSV